MAGQTTDLDFLSEFHFLQTIPYVEALEQSDDTDCFICKEPYDMRNRKWSFGASHNYPVRLPCRHVLGIQCLAHWMFSPDFGNQCCLCHAPILHGQDREFFFDDAARIMRCVRTATSGAGKEETIHEIRALQARSLTEGISRVGLDRVMIPYEVFVDQLVFVDQVEPQTSGAKVLKYLRWVVIALAHVLWGLNAVLTLWLALLSVCTIAAVHLGMVVLDRTHEPIVYWLPWITLEYSVIVFIAAVWYAQR